MCEKSSSVWGGGGVGSSVGGGPGGLRLSFERAVASWVSRWEISSVRSRSEAVVIMEEPFRGGGLRMVGRVGAGGGEGFKGLLWLSSSGLA